MVDEERGVRGRQETKEVPLKGLNASFGRVGSFLLGRDEVVDHTLSREEVEESLRSFAVYNLDLKMVTQIAKEAVSCQATGTKMCGEAGDERFHMDVSLVDRE